MRRPATPRFRHDRPPSRASDAARADALQVQQAAQPRERHRQGRRAAGAEGVAPVAGRGAGCHSGRGRGIGERGGLLAAELRDGRGEAEPSLPGTEPIGISPPHGLLSTKHLPRTNDQGAVPELKPLELGEGRDGPCEARGALWAHTVIPVGGAWGKRGVVRRGRWASRWQVSHVESDAKKRQKQHRSAIDPRVLIFIGKPAASSQHPLSIASTRVAIRCSSPSTRDGQTLKLSRIGIFQNHKFTFGSISSNHAKTMQVNAKGLLVSIAKFATSEMHSYHF